MTRKNNGKLQNGPLSAKGLSDQNQLLADANAALRETIATMQLMISTQAETIASLQETIQELQETIRELNEKLNKNSRNSSKPPSSDGYKKPSPKSLRSSSGKKQGGQTGHEGTHLSVPAEPDHVIPHMPAGCSGCPHYEACLAASTLKETRNVIDARVEVEITAHQALCVTCPVTGIQWSGGFPEDIRAAVQYGPNLQALAVSLNTVGAVSYNRTGEILRGIFGIPISNGTINQWVMRCSGKLDDTMDAIASGILNNPYSYCDETGARADGKLRWVHVMCNERFTYLSLQGKRGKEAMDAIGLLPAYGGVATHDCWSPYWKYEDIVHNICRAHLLRELLGIMENHPEQVWAKGFSDLLLKMKKTRDKAVQAGKEDLSKTTIWRLEKEYDTILTKAYQENPEPERVPGKRGRRKRGKVLALIDRLSEYKASVCLFIKDLNVPFDNNQAERDLRMIKTKTKVSGSFRTESGGEDYMRIMSCVSTGRKHGHNAFEVIRQIVLGNPQFALT